MVRTEFVAQCQAFQCTHTTDGHVGLTRCKCAPSQIEVHPVKSHALGFVYRDGPGQFQRVLREGFAILKWFEIIPLVIFSIIKKPLGFYLDFYRESFSGKIN